ncbi:MAG TPA: hypothetical protein ENJ54_04200 [Chloroflexi bacterium]|nr:hypothetical protein [Chloroflexota bacterium]
MSERPWMTNDVVETPKGRGVVQGWMMVEGAPQVLVRLRVPGESVPECETPRAKVSSLWLFPPNALQRWRQKR